MKPSFLISITFMDLWHAGSGLTGGASIDALVRKNADGMPFFPGKSIKGYFHEMAREISESFPQKMPLEWVHAAFGRGATEEEDSSVLKEGSLHFSDARLDAQTLGALIEGDIPPSVFFQSLASTAIERSTGTAKDASLRTIEVAIPMELFFEITLFEAGQSFSSKEHSSYLSLLCGSIKSMGHKKTRGFGRCTIALIQKPS